MTDENISRAAVEGAVRARISYHRRAQANANRELGRCIGENDRARWRAEEAKHAMAKQAMETLFNEVSALPPAPVEGEGLREADARQIRMAVAAWLEGRRDAEFWLRHIHVTLGSPTRAALSQTPGGED